MWPYFCKEKSNYTKCTCTLMSPLPLMVSEVETSNCWPRLGQWLAKTQGHPHGCSKHLLFPWLCQTHSGFTVWESRLFNYYASPSSILPWERNTFRVVSLSHGEWPARQDPLKGGAQRGSEEDFAPRRSFKTQRLAHFGWRWGGADGTALDPGFHPRHPRGTRPLRVTGPVLQIWACLLFVLEA